MEETVHTMAGSWTKKKIEAKDLDIGTRLADMNSSPETSRYVVTIEDQFPYLVFWDNDGERTECRKTTHVWVWEGIDNIDDLKPPPYSEEGT